MASFSENIIDSAEAFNELLKLFKAVTVEPTQFLLVLPLNKQEDIKVILQNIYRAGIQNDDLRKSSQEILYELVMEDMDEEQIWQQLEMRNKSILHTLIENTAKLLSVREEKLEVRLDEDDSESRGGDHTANGDYNPEKGPDIVVDFSGEGSDDENKNVLQAKEDNKTQIKVRPSIVDDKFFKLDEMEAFLEEEEAKELCKKKQTNEYSSESVVDYFAEDLGVFSEEDGDKSNPIYKEFFDENDEEPEEMAEGRSKKWIKGFTKTRGILAEELMEMDDGNIDPSDDDDNNKYNENNEDDEGGRSESKGDLNNVSMQPASSASEDVDVEIDSKDEKPQSSFEIRQTRLQQRIREYEAVVLGEKPWQLKGEINATNRPQNSLLEELLEFDSTARPAPVITEKTTRCLEDIIKQRIRDQVWDDPIPVVRREPSPHEYRKQLVLDQEKSKQSLAQVYEKEYQQQMDKFDQTGEETVQEEPKEHKEIKQLMRALFLKLDALSNFHFTPKPVAPEVRIITNTPSVVMEEVAPVTVSDVKLLAPEEVFRGPKHELVGKTERNRTDKKRERRKKKQKQRVINRVQEKKCKKKQELGMAPTKKEENTKLLKSLTKRRNVQKVNVISDNQRALKSSKSFFSKLQDTTSAADQFGKANKRKSSINALTAKRVKL